MEVKSFLDDADSAKRAKLIDKLLNGPEFPRRLEQIITVRLLDRRPGEAIPDAEWSEYIQRATALNTPWNQLVRDLISADGRDERHRPAIRFFAEGNRGDAHQLTRDIGRIFLGMNLNCSQCYDDPNVASFKQVDYFGIYSYLRQSQMKPDKMQKPILVETVAAGKQEFQSVFTGVKDSIGPRLPGGKEVAIPKFEKGQELALPPKDGLPGKPKFRPPELLAEHLTDNTRFARVSANYFWFVLMGRVLVHPLDLMHDANPASHPELLGALTEELVRSKYDLKHYFREITLSEAYQRSSLLPDGISAEAVDISTYRVAIPRALSAEQLALSAMLATGQLERIVAAPPKNSKFTYKDYINNRVPPPDTLAGVLIVFRATFGNPPGEPEVEFSPSASQALFLMNDKLILKWLDPQSPGLVADLAKQPTADAAAELLYARVLTRKPTKGETAIVADYLRKQEARRPAARRDLVTALLASSEFRFNH